MKKITLGIFSFLLIVSFFTLLTQKTSAEEFIPGAFVTTWKTDNSGVSESNQVTIPIYKTYNFVGEEIFPYTYNYNINWGDGNTDSNVTSSITHTYANPDIYTISITGTYPAIYFENTGYDNKKIISVEQWGDINWSTMNNAFYGASNLTINATDYPDLSNVTDMSFMFSEATSFNQNIDSWDVSSVTNMTGLFEGATSFNQNIGSWDVSKVKYMNSIFHNATSFNQDISEWNMSGVVNMTQMFSGATSFNQDISGWSVSNVTDMTSVFVEATSFNQNIGSWDVSKVTNMAQMFSGATSFNQDISGWSVSNVEYMNLMFQGATSFNGDISDWDVSNVTSMSYMFSGATSFNQDIGGWIVSKVTNTSYMFNDATSFNGDISDWDVSNVTSMSSMFSGATSFNQDIGGWIVSKVTNTSYMFNDATSFNQDISGWIVSSVTNMSHMFNNATSFNGNIGDWDVSNVTDMSNILYESNIETNSYNSILYKWSQLDLQDGLELNVIYTTYYFTYQQYKDILINNFNWTITDDGIKGPKIIDSTLSGSKLTLTFDGNLDESSILQAGIFSLESRNLYYLNNFNNEEDAKIVIGEGTPNAFGEDTFDYSISDGKLIINNIIDDWVFPSIDPEMTIDEGSLIRARVKANVGVTPYTELTVDDEQEYVSSNEKDKWFEIELKAEADRSVISFYLMPDISGSITQDDFWEIDWAMITGSQPTVLSNEISNITVSGNTITMDISPLIEENPDKVYLIKYEIPETGYIKGATADEVVIDFYNVIAFNETRTLTVSSSPATDITNTTAVLNGEISSLGEGEVTSVGFDYGKTSSYDLNTETSGSYTAGSFSKKVIGLTCGTIYHFNAYANSGNVTGYGGDQTFKTLACEEERHHSSSKSTGSTAASIATFQAKQQENIINPVVTTTPNPSTSPLPVLITKTLKYKMTDLEVKILQEFLNSHGYVVSGTGAGSLGHETTYFGLKTKSAVMRFQKANGLVTDGIVGPLTRSKIK